MSCLGKRTSDPINSSRARLPPRELKWPDISDPTLSQNRIPAINLTILIYNLSHPKIDVLVVTPEMFFQKQRRSRLFGQLGGKIRKKAAIIMSLVCLPYLKGQLHAKQDLNRTRVPHSRMIVHNTRGCLIVLIER